MSHDDALLSPALASALSNLVSISASSRISLGDRALDAAVCVLVTTLFSMFITWLQKKKNTTQLLREVREAWRTRTFKRMSFISLGCGATDFADADAPTAKLVAQYKFALSCEGETARALVNWAVSNRGWGSIFAEPAALNVTRNLDGSLSESPEKPMFPSRGFNGIPVWYHAPTRTFVYLTSYLGNDEYTGLVTDCEEALQSARQHFEAHSKTHTPPSGTSERQLLSADGNQECAILSKKHSFEHLFFEQKDVVLDFLQRFRAKRVFAPHLGEDNKLGILMYGPPGTGKTRTVIAMANMLQRNVVQVSSHDMKSADTLRRAFTNCRDIVCFDEFDRLLEGVEDDSVIEEGGAGAMARTSMAVEYLKLATSESDRTKRELFMKKHEGAMSAPAKVDRAFLLSHLQGIGCLEGRIIVATTNNPDAIDDALKRPGRFDLILRLGYCTRRMLLDIVCHYFQVTGEARTELEHAFPHLPEHKFAPATVQLVSSMSTCAHNVLQQLMTRPADPFAESETLARGHAGASKK